MRMPSMAVRRGLRLTAALAYRDFRLFWAGSALSISGRQTSMVAMGWLLFDITGSPLLHSLGNLQIGALAVLVGTPAAVALAGAVVAAFAIFVAGSDRQIRGLRQEPAPAAEKGSPAGSSTTAPSER